MLHSVKEAPRRPISEHKRRIELIRPARTRRQFPKRQAKRHLQKKETRWAPIAYSVFAGAILIILGIAYSTYAFSKYRDEVLPGVQVDNVSLSGLTKSQAAKLIDYQEAAIGRSPVRLVYGVWSGAYAWVPTQAQIGFYYQPKVTAQHALDVGRTESFLTQLIDRLPFHPTHEVALAYVLAPTRLDEYLRSQIASRIHLPSRDAQIVASPDGSFVLRPAKEGFDLDLPATEDTVHSILGSLTKQTRTLSVTHTHPAIADADAERILGSVNRFLASSPVFGVGKRVFASTSASFARMLSFRNVVSPNKPPLIKMVVNVDQIHSYVAALASQIDRPAQNATFDFSGGKVIVVNARRTGRTLDQTEAFNQIVKVVSALKPRAQIHLKVAVTQPPLDTSNPASLGISTLLGEGTSSFPGPGATRLQDIIAIAKALNNTLISPDQDISFNTLVGNNWLDRMYDDHERSVGGQIVPSNHGGMQQVATTFLRAMFQAGMTVEERHAHPYRLTWYEPPIGLDAIVNPGRNLDLRFTNSAHKYLLIQTRVEPIRRQLYIYVYGPQLHWKVKVEAKGTILRTIPHGPTVTRQDTSLPPGVVQQTAWAHDGADTVVHRTIIYPHHRVVKDKLATSYQPWQAIVSVGASATPQPHEQSSTPTPTPSGAQPTPSPTFNH
jgi:vancomycin resistance protein YoaR